MTGGWGDGRATMNQHRPPLLLCALKHHGCVYSYPHSRMEDTEALACSHPSDDTLFSVGEECRDFTGHP